jgi:hypothetical protein
MTSSYGGGYVGGSTAYGPGWDYDGLNLGRPGRWSRGGKSQSVAISSWPWAAIANVLPRAARPPSAPATAMSSRCGRPRCAATQNPCALDETH